MDPIKTGCGCEKAGRVIFWAHMLPNATPQFIRALVSHIFSVVYNTTMQALQNYCDKNAPETLDNIFSSYFITLTINIFYARRLKT